MPAEMTLAEILEEAKRVLMEHNAPGLDEQERAAAARVVAGYSLIYLPRLVAVAEAAVEMHRVLRSMNHGCENPTLCPCAASAALRAWDALASPAPGAGEEEE
jgi:hypothetical protein